MIYPLMAVELRFFLLIIAFGGCGLQDISSCPAAREHFPQYHLRSPHHGAKEVCGAAIFFFVGDCEHGESKV